MASLSFPPSTPPASLHQLPRYFFPTLSSCESAVSRPYPFRCLLLLSQSVLMSHLTAPMPSQTGHQAQKPKPYLHDIPRPAHPLTPPDTDYETHPSQAPAPNTSGLETEPLPPQLPPILDSPHASPYGTLHRKKPSVTYVHSSLREARERVVQRGLKWLVVVVPPASFATEHGHLGHTLSSGPSRRLSNGLLMPLYPTVSSLCHTSKQLTHPRV